MATGLDNNYYMWFIVRVFRRPNRQSGQAATRKVRMMLQVFNDDDVLIRGYRAMAEAIGETERRTRYLVKIGELPVGRIGGQPFTKPKWLKERFEQRVEKPA
jgi:hypothetical protein